MAAQSQADDKETAAKQAKLDQDAADARAKADAEAKRLAEVEANAQKAVEQAEDFGQPKAMHCPECRARLERYSGDNPHKQGTYVCPKHGRVRVDHGEIVP